MQHRPQAPGSLVVLSLLLVLATRPYSILVPRARGFFGHVGRYKLNRLALGTRLPSFWSVFLQLSSKDFPLLKTNIFKFPMTHETFLDGKW